MLNKGRKTYILFINVYEWCDVSIVAASDVCFIFFFLFLFLGVVFVGCWCWCCSFVFLKGVTGLEMGNYTHKVLLV